jgi:hypothetical protein
MSTIKYAFMIGTNGGVLVHDSGQKRQENYSNIIKYRFLIKIYAIKARP